MQSEIVQGKPKRKRRSKQEVEAAKDAEALERVKAKDLGPASTSTLRLHINNCQHMTINIHALGQTTKKNGEPNITKGHTHTHTLV